MEGRKKHTVRTIAKLKRDGMKIAMVTAYDAPTARFAAEGGTDIILVGDSLGMGALGYDDTIPVTMDDMIHHCRAVRRGAPDTFIVGDMPFMSYNISEEQALENASRFMQQGMCDAVKLECDSTMIHTVKRIVECGIPVLAHIGLLPQSIKTAGGYRISGRSDEEAAQLLENARQLQEAGVFAIVLECVPKTLAGEISKSIEVPTIGIGAGVLCDGQVQVISDLTGLFSAFKPKHAKRYAELGLEMKKAITQYVEDVKSTAFPTDENSF